jgi:hypothetical protein
MNIVKALRGFMTSNLYKGKAGENFRVATCRLLECLALSGVELQQEDIVTFTVKYF